MKPLYLFGLIIIVAVMGIGGYIASNQQNPSTANNSTVNSSTISTSTTQPTSDKYVNLSSEALSQNSDKRRVLFFYASWCPTCRPADANISQNQSQLPDDVVVIRVNYNDPDTDATEKALASQYGVTYQHTYVQIDGSGNQVAKWNGGQLEELLANIK